MTLVRYSFESTDAMCDIYHFTLSRSKGTNRCHGNAGCQVTWPRNLQYMAKISKSQRSVNFEIDIYLQHEVPYHVT